MGRIDDLTGNTELDSIKQRLADLESRDPLSNSAVSGGRTRFIGEDSFLIEGSGGVSGTLRITGLEVVDGELRIHGHLNVDGPTDLSGDTDITGSATVSGDFHVTGPTNLDGVTVINGDTTVEGPFRVKGPMGVYGTLGIHGDTSIDGHLDIDGDTDITGDTTVTGDLTLDGNGRLKVGDVTIYKSGGRGKVDFGTGEIASDGTKVAMQSGSALVGVGGGIAQLTLGGNGFRVDSGGIRIGDLPVTDNPPNLYIDSNNKLWRTTGSSGGGTAV
jgi:cytoskeletal protein CcmA (bactofilin family)